MIGKLEFAERVAGSEGKGVEVEREEDLGAGKEGLTGAESGVDIADVGGVSRAEVRTRLARRVVRNAGVSGYDQHYLAAQTSW